MCAQRVQFRVPPELQNFLEARARFAEEPLSETARRMLSFYRALLRHGQGELARLRLTPPEALLIMDACNGWLITPEAAHLVWAQVEEAIQDERLDEKWKVDGAALVRKLRSLSPAGAFALADYVLQFYGGQNRISDVYQRLKETGFPLAEANQNQ